MPDEIIAVPGVPHTRTGKRLEVPLKRLFQGVDPAKAVNLGAVDDASAVEHYIALAKARAGPARSRLTCGRPARNVTERPRVRLVTRRDDGGVRGEPPAAKVYVIIPARPRRDDRR